MVENFIQSQNENVPSDPDDEAIGIEGEDEVVLETGNGIEAPCADVLDNGIDAEDAANQNDTQSIQTEAENVA